MMEHDGRKPYCSLEEIPFETRARSKKSLVQSFSVIFLTQDRRFA